MSHVTDILSVLGLSSLKAGLRDVTCTVPEGARVAVIGPNGAGKTTFLRLLAGLDVPHAGQVLFRGNSVCGMRLKERARHIAYLSQHGEADPSLTVKDYVQFARLPFEKNGDLDARCVQEAIDRCDIASFLEVPLGRLSGGEQQRVMLARCLAQTPDLLLLDEPTNHLDLAARARLLRMVRELNCTVIAVLHDLSLVPEFADQVVMINDGRVVMQGKAHDVLLSECCQSIFQLNIEKTFLADGTQSLHFRAWQ